MKTVKNKRFKYLTAIVILIFMFELMLQFDNRIVQGLGIGIIPIIVIYGILFIRNEQRQI